MVYLHKRINEVFPMTINILAASHLLRVFFILVSTAAGQTTCGYFTICRRGREAGGVLLVLGDANSIEGQVHVHKLTVLKVLTF